MGRDCPKGDCCRNCGSFPTTTRSISFPPYLLVSSYVDVLVRKVIILASVRNL